MSTYFPYSYIIQSLCNDVRRVINRHDFFGDWNVCEQQAQPQSTPVAISEIYY